MTLVSVLGGGGDFLSMPFALRQRWKSIEVIKKGTGMSRRVYVVVNCVIEADSVNSLDGDKIASRLRRPNIKPSRS
jgi:hypothetical protein